MKYRIFFAIAVLWSMALTDTGLGYDPLYLYYHAADKKYVLTTPENTKELALMRDLVLSENLKRPVVICCCPAETKEQRDIQKQIDQDLDNKFQALFVKKKNNSNDDSNKTVECANKYYPSARRVPNDEILIGYAVHEFLDNDIDWSTQNNLIDQFIWVYEKQIKYDTHGGGGVRSVHYIFPNQHSDTGTCHDYNLGSNIIKYEPQELDKLYSRDNQNTAFEYIARPPTGEWYQETAVTNNRKHRYQSSVETIKKQAYEQVVMHQLIPIEDFSEEHLKADTCAYMNIAPIWSSVHDGSLKNVEKYIRGIADKLPTDNSLHNKLKVRTILKEVMKDSKNTVVYLDLEKHRYPIRLMLVNVVSYLYSPIESNQQQEPLQELRKKPKERHLYIAIVTHNELVPPKRTLCEINVCGQLGWHVASTEGGLTYCCSLRDLNDLVTNERIPVNHEPFNLNEILPELANPAPPEAKEKGTNPAVVLLYYPKESTYKYADFKQLEELHLQSNTESQFTDILLYCPPETIDEKVSAALLKVNMMFVRKTVQMVSNIGDINICADRYKPAIWRNRSTYRRYHIGYLVSEHKTSMKNVMFNKIADKWKSGFRGVRLFSMEYNASYASPISSEHVMTAKKLTTGSLQFCENHMNTGIENLTDANKDTFVHAYNRENQKNNLNYGYDSSHYFVMKQLVPTDDFDDHARRLATCSYMNVYPVWNLVHNALIGVENYLRKILKASQFVKNLYIQTQLIDELHLPVRLTTPPTNNDANGSTPVSSPEKVYLDPDSRNLTVPARILKIIGHRVPLPQKQGDDSNKNKYRYYFMVIVFENTMNWDGNSYDGCNIVLSCTDLGWDVEEWKWERDYNRPYCCRLHEIPRYEENLHFDAGDEKYGILDLKKVVTKFDEKGDPQYENIASLINHEKKGMEEGSD